MLNLQLARMSHTKSQDLTKTPILSGINDLSNDFHKKNRLHEYTSFKHSQSKKKKNNEKSSIEADDLFNSCKKVSFIKYSVIT